MEPSHPGRVHGGPACGHIVANCKRSSSVTATGKVAPAFGIRASSYVLPQIVSEPHPLPPPGSPSALPQSLLYATSARVGGSGLDSVAHEELKASARGGFLGRALAYGNRQRDVPARSIRTLRFHPVRLLSFLDRPHYYGAKKHYVDWVAARELRSGRYDLFHGWSGESLRALREARRRKIPSLLECGTWHRNKGKRKPGKTLSERKMENAPFPQSVLNRLLVSRQHVMEEYRLASLIIVLSSVAAETFLAEGFPESKLFKLERGVDVERYQPGTPPPLFRAVFVGALIKRKGVHHLLEAWRRLALKDAELVLVGAVHDEMKPFLQQYAIDSVKVVGFASRPAEYYRTASVHILPSSCEGSAKTTYEAAACALPQITTRESGDIVVHGENGIIIPPEDPDALAAAIEELYRDPSRMAQMGLAGRKRVVENFTWEHFRQRLLEAYRRAMALRE